MALLSVGLGAVYARAALPDSVAVVGVDDETISLLPVQEVPKDQRLIRRGSSVTSRREVSPTIVHSFAFEEIVSLLKIAGKRTQLSAEAGRRTGTAAIQAGVAGAIQAVASLARLG